MRSAIFLTSMVRIHVCWGNYEGPHTHDIAFTKIVRIVLGIKAQGIALEAANPRHAHEWAVWLDFTLPDDKLLLPGVIDTSTNYVEHPSLVAERIVRFAHIVGRERVIANTDCGFGTAAGYGKLDPEIVFLKLGTLVAGAAQASKQLWALAGPQFPARDAGAFDQRPQLGPGNIGMHFVAGARCAKTAIGAGDHALASDHLGEPNDALRHQFRMLDQMNAM